MAEHAKLSASAAKRWMSCPPSALLEAEYPDQGSAYAEEGTYAHSLAETLLRLWNTQGVSHKAKTEEIRTLSQNKYHNQSLEEHVQAYVNLVKAKYREACKRSKDAFLGIERRVDFSTWVPGGFGTADAVILSDGQMEIVDLKFGRGVRVVAQDNPQIRLYALGALDEYDLLYDIETVRMTICQPRVEEGITTEEMTVEALCRWAEQELAPRAQLAAAGEGDFAVGTWCTFCKHRGRCRARAEEALRLVQKDFALKDPYELTPEEIGAALHDADSYIKWIKDIQQTALEDLMRGQSVPGWKAVAGRSNRTYADPEAVAAALTAAGYDPAAIYAPRELKGLTALEKAVGKKKLERIAGTFIVKPEGKPTLAPEDDVRPALAADSKKAFEEEPIDE